MSASFRRQLMQREVPLPREWQCYAKPAALGRTCGFINTNGGMLYGLNRLVCCESCGCTKKASDDRRSRAER